LARGITELMVQPGSMLRASPYEAGEVDGQSTAQSHYATRELKLRSLPEVACTTTYSFDYRPKMAALPTAGPEPEMPAMAPFKGETMYTSHYPPKSLPRQAAVVIPQIEVAPAADPYPAASNYTREFTVRARPQPRDGPCDAVCALCAVGWDPLR
jgi:hypothetical protein